MRQGIRKFSSVAPHKSYKPAFGTGGRSSVSGINATVFGGSGFCGRYVMNELGACGSRVYFPYRGCELEVRHVKPAFDLGMLGYKPFSPRDEESIVDSLKSSDTVINMIGKHYETKHLVPTRRANGKLSNINYNFDEVHVEIPRRLARLAREAGAETFIHMSALSADLESDSNWCRTKALGEIAVREEFPDAIIVKPATVFGFEDRFLNWIAEANKRLPFMPLLDNGRALVQPVYCVDIAKAMMVLVRNADMFKGKSVQLCGPAEYTYKEVIEFVSDVTTVKKPMIDVPVKIAKFAGRFIQETPAPFLTEDMVTQMLEDNVALPDPKLITFKNLGIEPVSMDKVAFDYLHRFRPGGHFTKVEGYY